MLNLNPNQLVTSTVQEGYYIHAQHSLALSTFPSCSNRKHKPHDKNSLFDCPGNKARSGGIAPVVPRSATQGVQGNFRRACTISGSSPHSSFGGLENEGTDSPRKSSSFMFMDNGHRGRERYIKGFCHPWLCPSSSSSSSTTTTITTIF